MASIVALEHDRSGLRAAVVGEDGKILQLTQVDDDTLESPAAIADALRAALPDVRWGRVRLVAVLSNNQVRCRLLKLPPAPDAELPDLVRMQAAREFATGEGQGVVDYVPLEGDATSPHSVLAATVSGEDLRRVRAIAEKLDADLQRVVARGAAAASLALRAFPTLQDGSHLLVAGAVDSLDLAVLQQGRPGLLRSTRIAGEADPQAFTSEARRTAAMATQQLGVRIDSTVYLGLDAPPSRSQPASLDLPLKLTQSFGLPLEQAELAARLSGVIGAAIDQAEQTRPAFDFVNPRQPVRDTSSQRRRVIWGSALAALVLLAIGGAWWRLSSLDKELSAARRLLSEERQATEQDEPIRTRAATIDAWLETNFNWLEEIDRIGLKLRPKPLNSEDFPVAEDVYLRQFTALRFQLRDESGGRIELRTLARNASEFDEVEERLRDERRQVETSVGSVAAEAGEYTWETQTTLSVTPETREDLP